MEKAPDRFVWRTWLAACFGFLECPPAMMDTLLRQWREYMDSPQYTQERDRVRRDRKDENKQSEVNAKVKVHSLRHQRRRCKTLSRKLREGTRREVPYSQQDLYARFLVDAWTKRSTRRRRFTVMVLLARGNESVLLDLGLVERLYFNSGGLHSADLIFYGLQYVFSFPR